MKPQWRKKPIDVIAAIYDADNMAQVIEVLMHSKSAWVFNAESTEVPELKLFTIDGNEVTVPYGAYVCLDPKKYAYPCDAEVFEENHEPISEVKAK